MAIYFWFAIWKIDFWLTFYEAICTNFNLTRCTFHSTEINLKTYIRLLRFSIFTPGIIGIHTFIGFQLWNISSNMQKTYAKWFMWKESKVVDNFSYHNNKIFTITNWKSLYWIKVNRRSQMLGSWKQVKRGLVIRAKINMSNDKIT